MSDPGELTVLHYVGCDRDQGGIVAIVRALAEARQFQCVLGVNRGFTQRRTPPLPAQEFLALPNDELNPGVFWRARAVAREVRTWLDEAPRRIFHGHSRAGLAVALWLRSAGEKRAVTSVHCYGKRRWFYRWAARRLGDRLFWLSPAMKRYYGLDEESGGWAQCVPGCVALPDGPWHVPGDAQNRVVRLGGVGALVPGKRWHLVLDGLAALPSAVRAKFRFMHIGATDGTDKSERYAQALRHQTAALGLERIVEWLGEQPTAQDFLREMDCLVVPAHREPFSVAMLEALALGVPVLAANSGGARDIVVPARNGWHFVSGDPRDLARSFAMLAESDALRTVRLRREDLAPFSAPVVAAEWARIYGRVLAPAT